MSYRNNTFSNLTMTLLTVSDSEAVIDGIAGGLEVVDGAEVGRDNGSRGGVVECDGSIEGEVLVGGSSCEACNTS